jgi:hypothetical protein
MPDGSLLLSIQPDTDCISPAEMVSNALRHADMNIYVGGIDIDLIDRAFAQVRSALQIAGRRAGGRFTLIFDQGGGSPSLHAIHFEFKDAGNRRRFECIGFGPDIGALLKLTDRFARRVAALRVEPDSDQERAVTTAIRETSSIV